MMQGRLDLEIVFLDHLLITETIQFTLSFYTITMHFSRSTGSNIKCNVICWSSLCFCPNVYAI